MESLLNAKRFSVAAGNWEGAGKRVHYPGAAADLQRKSLSVSLEHQYLTGRRSA
jgi:hypothetical protein